LRSRGDYGEIRSDVKLERRLGARPAAVIRADCRVFEGPRGYFFSAGVAVAGPIPAQSYTVSR
jgi:hypothetical protein